MSLPIGLQLWSIWEAVGEDMFASLRQIKAMGYEGVEFAGFNDHDAGTIRSWLADLGLSVAGSHVRVPGILEDFDSTVAYHKVLGCDNLTIASLPQEYIGSLDALRKTASMFDGLSNKLKNVGMSLAFHNHDRELVPVEGKLPLEVLFDNCGDDVLVQLDIGWAITARADVSYLLTKYARRIASVHVKETKQRLAVTGEGEIDWKPILAQVESSTTATWLIIEHERYIESPMIDVKKCFNNLRAMIPVK